MQFVVTAFDGTDDQAMARRMAAREAHLEAMRPMKKSGKLINGGAILDDDGNMIGSTLFVEFPSREELDEWLRNDPYTKGEVWEEVTVRPIKLA